MNEKEGKQAEKQEELDTETTFADMNIDGFKWYDPSKKSAKKGEKIKLTRKEKWAITKAVMISMLPVFGIVCAMFAILYLIVALWLG